MLLFAKVEAEDLQEGPKAPILLQGEKVASQPQM